MQRTQHVSNVSVRRRTWMNTGRFRYVTCVRSPTGAPDLAAMRIPIPFLFLRPLRLFPRLNRVITPSIIISHLLVLRMQGEAASAQSPIPDSCPTLSSANTMKKGACSPRSSCCPTKGGTCFVAVSFYPAYRLPLFALPTALWWNQIGFRWMRPADLPDRANTRFTIIIRSLLHGLSLSLPRMDRLWSRIKRE